VLLQGACGVGVGAGRRLGHFDASAAGLLLVMLDAGQLSFNGSQCKNCSTVYDTRAFQNRL
jgi:hypothetical protein